MSILVNVVNQKMYVSSTMEDIVAGSQQFVKFRFNLSDEWDGLLTFAQFRQSGKAYNQYLDNENAVYLPPEIGAGTCTLMLYGSNDTVIGTTNYLTFKVNENTLVSDVSSTDISESLYTQLVTQIMEYREAVVALARKVDALSDSGINQDAIDAVVKKELDEYIASGVLSNLTLENGSVTKEKLASDIVAALDKAELSGNMDFKGAVAAWDDLPQTKNIGDTYAVKLGIYPSIVTWNGSEWLYHSPLPMDAVVMASGGLVTSGAVYTFVQSQIDALTPTLDEHSDSITNLLGTVPVGSTLLRYRGQVPSYTYVGSISNVTTGDVLFCADENCFYMWNGNGWKQLSSGSSNTGGGSGGDTGETSSLPTKKSAGEFITAENVYTAPLANMVLFGQTKRVGNSQELVSTINDAGVLQTVVLSENLCTVTGLSASAKHATFSTPTLSPLTLAIKTASGNTQVNYKLEYTDGDRLDAPLVETSKANGLWALKVITPAKPVASVTLYNVPDGNRVSRTADGLFIGLGDYNDNILTTTVTNGLCGIPVTNTARANYIDAYGQAWCCDTVDYGKGKHIKRIEIIRDYTDGAVTGEYLSSTGDLSAGATVYYILDEPIETDISAVEIAQYNALHITAPDATIFNTCSTPMEVEYYVPLYSVIYDEVMKELEAKLLGGASSSTRVAEVTLDASSWTGEDNLYSQVVLIAGVTEYSRVDLNPSPAQLAIFHNKDITFVTENEDGVVTVYCIGQKPVSDYTMQVTITEVIF